jgi:hypothetical protein
MPLLVFIPYTLVHADEFVFKAGAGIQESQYQWLSGCDVSILIMHYSFNYGHI